MARLTILDGPMGTELLARGVPTPTPLWSAWALRHAPDVVAAIHADYAAAGATVHTANTFRTRARTCPDDWQALTRAAVALARGAVPADHRVAGSIAPLEDCYRPDLSPPVPAPEHQAMAEVLAEAGCDLLLCETFPHVGEGLAAVSAAVATGLPTWAAFTAGPQADLLSPQTLADACAAAADLGAAAVLVNCVPAARTGPFVEVLARRLRGLVPFGAYANAGQPDEGMGWRSPDAQPDAGVTYLEWAEAWVGAGATLVGSCCGTGPAVTRALSQALRD